MGFNDKHACSCCTISRRSFVAGVSTALLATVLSQGRSQAESAESRLGDYIDLSSFRPDPKVRIMSAVLRQPPPYWMGWPGASYDLEGNRNHLEKLFATSAQNHGVELAASDKPLETHESVETFAKKVNDEKPDAILITVQHWASWNWAERIADLGFPTIVFSPIGVALKSSMDKISRQRGVVLISSLDDSGLDIAFKMVRAKRQFEETRLLTVVLPDPDPNASVLHKTYRRLADATRPWRIPDNALGTRIHYVPRDFLYSLFIRMPENDEVNQVAKAMAKGAEKIVEPTHQDLLNAAKAFTAAKRLLKDQGCNAITTDCLGMLRSKLVPTPPCLAASMFQDAGVTYGCEADIWGALSLMLPSYLFDKPGFMSNPVPETVRNHHIATHCVSATRLRGFKEAKERYILRSHAESNIGVSTQVIWSEGQPVTMIRFQDAKRLLLYTGTVIRNLDTPPTGGCRTSIELVLDRIDDVREVQGHHQVVFYGNHRREIEAFCQMYSIDLINKSRDGHSAL